MGSYDAPAVETAWMLELPVFSYLIEYPGLLFVITNSLRKLITARLSEALSKSSGPLRTPKVSLHNSAMPPEKQ